MFFTVCYTPNLNMRKVIFGINVTLDGCCDHTKVIGDEEVHQYFGELLRDVDTLVYGRKTYQLMVPFWPDMAKDQSGPTASMNDFAKAFDDVERIVVFSRTLDGATEPNKTTIVRDDPQGEIRKLKQERGKNIMLGGVDIPSQLIEDDLIDEYQFIVHPIIAGEGRRLFDRVSLPEKLQLKLAESKTFSSGCVAHRYLKR
jgi:dihydrofolate reductase